MTTLFLENGSSLMIKNEVIYIVSKEENVFINASENPVSKQSRMFLENGDSIGTFNNQIFIDTIQTKVYVNDILMYQLFPHFVSESFREFCSHAKSIKKEKFGETEIVVAHFHTNGLSFAITTPPHENGEYRISFTNVLPTLSTNIGENAAMIKRFNFDNFNTDIGDKQNLLMLKSKKFNMNDLLHALTTISEYQQSNQTYDAKDFSA